MLLNIINCILSTSKQFIGLCKNACHKNKCPYYTWKKGVDLYEGLEFVSSFWGENLGGRLIRAVDLYVSIYSNMQQCLFIFLHDDMFGYKLSECLP